MNNRVRVNWFLVWCSLFGIMCPFVTFLLSIAAPTFIMPAWLFAGNMAVCYTGLMAWEVARIRAGISVPPPMRDPPPPEQMRRFWVAIGFAIVGSMLLIGLLGRLVVGMPSWVTLVACAVALPSSIFVANFLLGRSRLLEARAEALAFAEQARSREGDAMSGGARA